MASPTIQEIANMPYPSSVKAMRKYHNAAWGRDCGDGDRKSFEVSVSFRVRDDRSVTVEAFTEEEAKELASDKVAENVASDLCVSQFNVDIDDVEVISSGPIKEAEA